MSTGSAIVERLLEDSREELLLGQSEAYAEASFDDASAAAAVREVVDRADASAFHLLLALRDAAPAAYETIPPAVRAAVLVDALRTQPQLNDWGYLEPGGDGYDGPAADALLDTGAAAIERLRPLLDDDSPAEMTGSEIAEMAHRYGYRRKDFAARYLALLLGREPVFAENAAERDRAIAELRGA